MLALAAVLSTMHYEGEVAADGGDYAEVMFEVPTGTVELEVAHTDGSDLVILDWGVWGPEGFRGWGGGNSEDAVVGVTESSRSYLTGPMTPGTWRVVIGKALVGASGGHYSIDVTCRDAATLDVRPRAPYVPTVLASEARWYKGDFHVHDDESGDAHASFEAITTLARAQGIDFVNLSDHNTSSQYPLEAAYQPSVSDVLILRGAEITTYAGHMNGVGLSSYVDHRIGFEGRTIPAVFADVASQGGIAIINHPSLELGDSCIGCAWNHPDTPWDQVSGIEIITGKWEVVEPLFVGTAIALWDEQEAAGHRIAAVSGSDDHRAGTGTGYTDTPLGEPCTRVFASELSEAAIIDGVKQRRTIVNLTGPDAPELAFTIGDTQIGGDVVDAAEVDADVHVTGGDGDFVQLWRDGEKLAQEKITSADFAHTFTDVPGTADHRYRVEIVDDGGARLVVTSHIYVHGVAAPDQPMDSDDGGCCGATTEPPFLLGALVALPVLRRRRDRSRH